jgi:hypothetical protein
MKKIPNVNDYLRFTSTYTFVCSDLQAYELPKGSLAKVIDRDITFFGGSRGDEAECMLVISLMIDKEIRLFTFNFTLHQELVDVLEETKALEILFGPKKLT